MERLTFDGNFCDIAQCREMPCPYDNNCMQKQVWERLKSYEDTRLSPEGLKQTIEIEEYLNECGSSIARVAELIRADDERRVLVLPRKVGDEIWLTIACGVKLKEPLAAYVVAVTVGAEDKFAFRTNVRTVYDSEFGRTSFFTREEAEKALEAAHGRN